MSTTQTPTVRFLPVDRADEAEALWRDLEARGADVPTMRSWSWTREWIAAYGDEVRCRFAVVEDPGGEAIAVALIGRGRRRYGGIPIRSWWVGTANLPAVGPVSPEFNGPIVLPGREADAARALLAAATRERGWDELRLHGVFQRDADPYLEAWPEAAVRIERLPAPQLDLSGLAEDDDAAAAITNGSARRRCRTSMRAMAARAEITCEWATTAAEAVPIFDELVALHQARWEAQGEAGLFGPTRFDAFHRALAPRLVEEGRAVLFRARVGDETLGCLYHFVDGDRLRFYQSGFAQLDDNRLRPGIVTHLLCADEARRHGIRLYDFLSGDVRYKRQLSNGADEVLRVALRRRRVRFALYDAAVRVRDRRRAAREAGGDGAPAPTQD